MTGITPLKMPTVKKPTAFLPKRYNVGANIAHLEHVRPKAQAIGMALSGDAGLEGLKEPAGNFASGTPLSGSMAALRKVGAPPMVSVPKVHPLKMRGIK
jgi:hypothetical protein